MAAKKAVKAAAEEKVTAAKKVVRKAETVKPEAEVKKTAVKKAAPAKKAEEKKPVEKKVEEKKPVEKKAEEKPVEVKAEEKKPAEKKAAPAKKAAVEKKPAVAKKTAQEYKDVINWKKWEAHNMNWLYIEINAGDLMTELEAGVNNIKTVVEAILDSMLEGDTFIVESEKPSTKLTVRYYCDNLSEERRKYSEVNG